MNCERCGHALVEDQDTAVRYMMDNCIECHEKGLSLLETNPNKQVRIPVKWLKEIMDSLSQKRRWTFESIGGNVLVVTQVDGVDSLDFIYNPED